MKRILVVLGGAVVLGLAGSAGVYAQSCTDELGDALSSCIEEGVTSCANSIKECGSTDYSVTVNDIWKDAIRSCCKKKGKATRKACLSGYRRKLKTTGRLSALAGFLRTAKKKTGDIIKADCYNGAYSNLF